AIILYDAGKIFIILMCLTLDFQWASRRVRSLVGLVMLVVVVLTSSIVAIVIRTQHPDHSGLQPEWNAAQVNTYLMDQVMTHQRALLLTTYFFAGLASSFIELFGLWIIGTLTNDIKVSGRLVGIYQSTMCIGGLVGFQMVTQMSHGIESSNVPTYISVATTFVSLVLLFFVVRRITDTNDWTLASISNGQSDASADGQSTSTIAVIRDVKYQHLGDV
ncbi:hypothetical protein IWQ57_007070, partial [Coemansia nantahalensis]